MKAVILLSWDANIWGIFQGLGRFTGDLDFKEYNNVHTLSSESKGYHSERERERRRLFLAVSKILHFRSTQKNGIDLLLFFLRLQNRDRRLRASFCCASLSHCLICWYQKQKKSRKSLPDKSTHFICSVPFSPVRELTSLWIYSLFITKLASISKTSFTETFHSGLCSRKQDRTVKQHFEYSGASLYHWARAHHSEDTGVMWQVFALHQKQAYLS